MIHLGEDLQVGFELPVFERVGDFDAWNRYAAVNDEFVAIHMDDEAGRAAGYPSAFGMGNLHIAYLHALLRQWMGDTGQVLRLGAQFTNPAVRGAINRACGVIRSVDTDHDATTVELDIWVEDGAGNRLTPGSATVVLGDGVG